MNHPHPNPPPHSEGGGKQSKKILYFVAEADYFCSHRLHIALAALKASYQVALITRCNTAIQKKLEAFGITVFPLHHFKRGGFNPFHQIRSLLEIYSVYKRYKPDIVHQVALKPVIFGSWIANICGVPRVINALPGLGYLFTDASQVPEIPPPAFAYAAAGRPPFRKGGEGIKKIGRTLVLRLFKRIFATPNSILILQNTDDQNYLIQQGAIRPEQSVIIPGAGVALDHYKVTPFPPAPPLRIVCIARLLWDKGIGELTEAARILKAAGHPCEMILYGRPDPENPSSILEATLQAWEQAGLLRWAGHCEDVAAAYASAHIAVLPSYREGLPKSLLEAASCGRPIVTTDVPGCRAMVQALVHSHATSGLVQEGENGFLVPAQDPTALAQALARLIENPELRTRMGLAGRKCVEQSFSEQLVQKQTLTLYQ